MHGLQHDAKLLKHSRLREVSHICLSSVSCLGMCSHCGVINVL
jgi:hypothetical protein